MTIDEMTTIDETIEIATRGIDTTGIATIGIATIGIDMTGIAMIENATTVVTTEIEAMTAGRHRAPVDAAHRFKEPSMALFA